MNNLHENSFKVVLLYEGKVLLTLWMVILPETGLGVVPPEWLSSPHWQGGERNPELSPHTDNPDDTLSAITMTNIYTYCKGKEDAAILSKPMSRYPCYAIKPSRKSETGDYENKKET